MLLRIRREIFKPGEFEHHQEKGPLTRDELCMKYGLDKDTTVFYGNDGHIIESDCIDGSVVVAVQSPGDPATAVAVVAGVILAGLVVAWTGALIYAVADMMKMGSSKLIYADSLKGSTNPVRKNGPVGLLLGRYAVPADSAGLVYSDYKDNQQYIHQLFCMGYDTSIPIKDDAFVNPNSNPLGYVIHMGDSPIDIYDDLRLSMDTTYYDKRCVEEGLSIKMVKGEYVSRTSPTNTVRIGVGICAPYGYYKLNDKGDPQATYMSYIVEYCVAGTDEWQTLYTFNGDVNTQDGSHANMTYRRMAELSVPVGQYDVRATRLNDDNEDSTYNDTLMVELMQFDTVGIGDSPAPVRNPERYSLLSIYVRATDQMNGYLDQIYVDCFLKCRTYIPEEDVWRIPDDVSVVGTMNNPASIFLYLLTSPDANPRPLPDDRIDWISLTEWWKFCNDENRGWSVNAWVTEDITISELIKNVCMAGRAQFRIMDGKYGVIVEDKRVDETGLTITTQMFTPRNAWDMQETRSFEKQPNLLDVQFVNQETNSEEERFIIINSDGVVEVKDEMTLEDEESYETESLSLWGITDPRQLAQIGIYRLAGLHRLTRTYSWSCAIESIVCAVGDVVYLANDLFLFSLGYGRIVSVDRDEDGMATGIYVDEAMGIDPDRRYGVTVRLDDGTFKSIPVDQDSSESYHLLFESPVEGAVEEGNLFIYGEGEGKRVVIQEIQPDKDHGAVITAVDYVPELYDLDVDSVIPPYESNISRYGSGVNIGAGGSGRPDFDSPQVVPPVPVSLSLVFSGVVYHYDADGTLVDGQSVITATAILYGSDEPYQWKINGVVQESVESSIQVPSSFMSNRDNIVVEVSAAGIVRQGIITKVNDGADGTPGADAKLLSLSTDNNVFRLQSDGTPYPDQKATVSVRKQGIMEPTKWTVQNKTIADDTESIELEAGDLIDGTLTIRVTAGEYSDSLTLNSVKDGAPAIDPVLMDTDLASYTFPASSSGIISPSEYEKFKSTFNVSQSGELFSYVDSESSLVNKSFTMSATGDGITNLAVSNGAISATADSVMLHDSASISISIKYIDAYGTEGTFSYKISLAKAKDGEAGVDGTDGADAQLVKLHSDGTAFFFDTDGNPVDNTPITVTVEKQNIEGTTHWDVPCVNIPDGTESYQFTPYDMGMGNEVLTNVCPALSSNSFLNTTVSSTVDGEIRHCTVTRATYGIGLFSVKDIINPTHKYFVRVRMKNTNQQTVKLRTSGNTFYSPVEAEVDSGNDVVLTTITLVDQNTGSNPHIQFQLRPLASEDVTGFTFDILSSELIDITNLVNNHPYFASLSNSDKAALLDKGLPNIPAGESFTVGGTAENLVENYQGSESETTSSYNAYDITPHVNKSVTVNKNDVIYSKGLYKQTLINLSKSSIAPYLVIGYNVNGTRVPSVRGKIIEYNDYVLNSGIDICLYDSTFDRYQVWHAGRIITEGQPFENKIEWKDVITLNLTTSGWYLALLLRGYTTDAEIQAWLDANVPFFEDTMEFPSYDTLPITVTVGDYSDTITIIKTLQLISVKDTVRGLQSSIEANAEQIKLKVSQSDYDTKVTELESSITQTADKIALVVKDGKVYPNGKEGDALFEIGTVDGQGYILLDAEKIIATGTITGDKIQANSITGDKIESNSITGDKIKADTLTTKNLEVSGNDFSTVIRETDSEGQSNPVFGVIYGGKTIFKIVPESGRIFFGEPNTTLDAPASGFMYDPAEESVISANRKVIIRSDGTMRSENCEIFGTATIQSGLINAQIDCPSFSSLPSDGGDSYSASLSGNAQSQCSQIGTSFDSVIQDYSNYFKASVSVDSSIVYMKRNKEAVELSEIIYFTRGYSFYDSNLTRKGTIECGYPYYGSERFYSTWANKTLTVTVLVGDGDIFKFKNLPTSGLGLEIGQVYSDDGILKIKI